MTIYLPESTDLFRQAFDATCDRILRTKKDAAFYALSDELTSKLREHPLLKDYLHGLEAESAKQKQESSIAALEALEDSWMRLWKYHRHSLKHRKQLARIKRMITAPDAIVASPLYSRILFSMAEFRYRSPLFRSINEGPKLFRTAQSELNFDYTRLEHFYPSGKGYFEKRTVARCKLRKGDKRLGHHNRIFDSRRPEKAKPFTRSAECVYAALFSPKVEEIEQKSAKLGRDKYDKRQNMQIMAEISAAFCWERFCFLEKYWLSNGAFPVLTSFKGRWASVRESAWKSSHERCELDTILWGKMLPGQSPSVEYQIHRQDCEKYLGSLKSHIHAHLFKIADREQKSADDPSFALPGSKKEDFVAVLGRQYWKTHPSAKRDEVFENYLLECPVSRQLSRSSWDRIVRKRKLDPRSKEAFKRGAGKKTFQN